MYPMASPTTDALSAFGVLQTDIVDNVTQKIANFTFKYVYVHHQVLEFLKWEVTYKHGEGEKELRASLVDVTMATPKPKFGLVRCQSTSIINQECDNPALMVQISFFFNFLQ